MKKSMKKSILRKPAAPEQRILNKMCPSINVFQRILLYFIRRYVLGRGVFRTLQNIYDEDFP